MIRISLPCFTWSRPLTRWTWSLPRLPSSSCSLRRPERKIPGQLFFKVPWYSSSGSLTGSHSGNPSVTQGTDQECLALTNILSGCECEGEVPISSRSDVSGWSTALSIATEKSAVLGAFNHRRTMSKDTQPATLMYFLSSTSLTPRPCRRRDVSRLPRPTGSLISSPRRDIRPRPGSDGFSSFFFASSSSSESSSDDKTPVRLFKTAAPEARAAERLRKTATESHSNPRTSQQVRNTTAATAGSSRAFGELGVKPITSLLPMTELLCWLPTGVLTW